MRAHLARVSAVERVHAKQRAHGVGPRAPPHEHEHLDAVVQEVDAGARQRRDGRGHALAGVRT